MNPSDSRYTLTVIIPAYNEQEYIKSAITSVLDQVTNFHFELIIIDDGSTDATLEIATSLLEDKLFCTVVSLKENHGKGNAIRTAYSRAQGRYIQILDADDYLVDTNKFQRQVDFLDTNPHVSAVAHNTLAFCGNTANVISHQSEEITYTYQNIVKFEVYFHTSSLMIRRLDANLPDSFANVESLRGDSAFLYYHVYTLKGDVHYFPELMSVYRIHARGIWSKMSPLSKMELTRQLFLDLQTHIVRDVDSIEHEWLERKIIEVAILGESGFQSAPLIPISDLLSNLAKFAGQVYLPEVSVELSDSVNVSWSIDGISKAIGSTVLQNMQQRDPMESDSYEVPCVAILVSGFRQTGGGIFKEVLNLIRIHNGLGYKVIVISSQMSEELILEPPAELEPEHCTVYRVAEIDLHLKLKKIFQILTSAKPERVYALISHHDVVTNAVLQPRLTRSLIIYFVYDHISTLGVKNSSVDLILTRFESQIIALKSAGIEKRYSLVSPFVFTKNQKIPHQLFSSEKINSATASARPYKIEGKNFRLFVEVIGQLLQRSEGLHFHYGPLSEDKVYEVKDHLLSLSIDPNRVCFLPYTLDFQEDLLCRMVNVFVVTSEIQSINTSLEVMACGIPALVFLDERSEMLLNPVNIFGMGQIYWGTLDEFSEALNSLDDLVLENMSKSSFVRFTENYSLSRARRVFQDLEVASIDDSLVLNKNQDLERFSAFRDVYRKVFT
jgi:glycosyltransferase involved in cell wall biosynthesis